MSENMDNLNKKNGLTESTAEGTENIAKNGGVDDTQNNNAPEDNNDFENTDVPVISVENAVESKAPPEKAKKKSFSNPFKNKKFKYGGLSVLFTVIFITVIVLVNVIYNTLLDRFDVELDLTENKLFSIEESTGNYLKSINDKVTITIANEEAAFTSGGQVYQQANAIAKRFTDSNPNFNVRYVDLLTNPAFSGQYGGDINQVSIIIESENTGRYKVLASTDYCNVTYYTEDGTKLSEDEAYYYQMLGIQVLYDISASAEQAFLSAIMSVCDINPIRVAFASGYSEGLSSGSTTLSYSAFEELLDKNAYVTETIDLLITDTIDPDIDFIVIFAPNSDYNVETLTMLDIWLDNNGDFNKTVIYVASIANVDTPNLDGFLADWGMLVEKGGIYQTDANYASSQSAVLQYMQLQESDYTAGITNGSFIGTYLRPVTALFSESGNLATTPILSSYDGAVVMPFTDEDMEWSPDTVEKSVLHGVMESRKLAYKGTEAHISRVIAFGGPYIFDSSYLSASQLSNAELYMNIFNTISGKEEGITLRSKSFSMTTFNITAQTSNTIAIIFAVALPLLVAAAGIAVHVRRRYR